MHLTTTVSVDPAGIIPILRFGFEFNKVVFGFSNSISLRLVPGDSGALPAIHSIKAHHQILIQNMKSYVSMVHRYSHEIKLEHGS